MLERLRHHGAGDEALSVYLVDAAGTAFREALAAWPEKTPPPEGLRAALVSAFDRVLADAALYEPARFPGLMLTSEMLALQAAGTTPATQRFNRLLLEAAYGEAIAPRFRYYAVGTGATSGWPKPCGTGATTRRATASSSSCRAVCGPSP